MQGFGSAIGCWVRHAAAGSAFLGVLVSNVTAGGCEDIAVLLGTSRLVFPSSASSFSLALLAHRAYFMLSPRRICSNSQPDKAPIPALGTTREPPLPALPRSVMLMVSSV